MKIKHYAGYGCVTAKKVSCSKDTLVVEVRGEHECGLVRDDKMDVFDWLVKRFDKRREDWTEIESIKINDDYIPKEGAYTGYEEVATYTIKFFKKPY